MDPAPSDRAKSYVAAKRRFGNSVIELHQHLRSRMPASNREMVAMTRLIAAGTEAFLDNPDAHYPDESMTLYGWMLDPPHGDPPFGSWEDKGWIPRDFGREVFRDYVMLARHRIRHEKPALRDEEIEKGRHYIFPHLVKCSLPGSGICPDSDRGRAWNCAKLRFRSTVRAGRFWVWNAGIEPNYSPTLEALNSLMTEAFANTPSSDFPDALLLSAEQVLFQDRAVELLEGEWFVPSGSHLSAVRSFALLMRARHRYFQPGQDVHWGREYVGPDGNILI